MILIKEKKWQKITILLLGLKLFTCCNTKSNSTLEVENEKIVDTIIVNETKPQANQIKIDSVKMHAFDDLYFGTHKEITGKKYSVNDIDYSVTSSESKPKEGLCYFMLENVSNITTQQKANRVLNELKNTISKKYGGGENLNKTYYIKHPEEENDGNEAFFDERTLYKYDKKLIGLPYEFIMSKWSLKYKDIQIGYLIDHKNRTVFYQTSPREDDNYIIYIEITSKVIKPGKTNPKKGNAEKDSNKF